MTDQVHQVRCRLPLSDPAHPLAGLKISRVNGIPVSRQLANAVIVAIRAGRYQPGDYIASWSQLRQVLPTLSHQQRAAAWAILRREGWAIEYLGIGMVVRERSDG